MKSVSLSQLMRHIILLPLILLSSDLRANPGAFLNDQALNEELSSFSKITHLKSDFKQIKNVLQWDSEIVTTGQFQLRNSNKGVEVLWTVQSPAYSAIKLWGQELFVRNTSKGPWSQITSPRIKKNMKQIFAWLRFDVDQLKKSFNVMKQSKGHFDFLPKNEETHFKKISIFFDRPPVLKKMSLFEKNGDSIIIHFSNTKASQ